MVMILQFKDNMDELNKFFRKVYSSPAAMWKGIAALIFITTGTALVIIPSLTGWDFKPRLGFGGMMIIYGLFRLWTFYIDIKGQDDE